MRLSTSLGGSALLVAAWRSAPHTVRATRRSPNWPVSVTFRFVTETSLFLVRVVPWSLATSVLGFCAPAVAFGSAAFSLTGRVSITLLVLLTWLSTGGLVGAVVLHSLRFRAAYRRREQPVATLAWQIPRILDAETMLDRWLPADSGDDLDQEFERWAEWFDDLAASQDHHPTFVFARSASPMCWVDAGCIVLDAAALVRALAPRWAQPGSQAVLDAGITYLQQLTGALGITMMSRPVSLHGREEREFSETVRSALEAGLPLQQDLSDVWHAFQTNRLQYAPHAAAIGTRLCHGFPSPPPGD